MYMAQEIAAAPAGEDYLNSKEIYPEVLQRLKGCSEIIAVPCYHMENRNIHHFFNFSSITAFRSLYILN